MLHNSSISEVKLYRLNKVFPLLQSVYGVADENQSQPSPAHIPSQPARKPTKEDVQKEVTSSLRLSTGLSSLRRPLLQPPSSITPDTSEIQTDEPSPYLAFPLHSIYPPLSLAPVPLLQITFLNIQLDRHCLKVSKVADSLVGYTEQFQEYDPFVSLTEPSNPWISDDSSFWDLEAR